VLHSEFKPEHCGFRKACEVLFSLFKVEQLDRRGQQIPTQWQFADYCYGGDEMYTALDVEHVARFFVWVGVLKPACCAEHPLCPASVGRHATTQAASSRAIAAAEPTEALDAPATACAVSPRTTRLQQLNQEMSIAMQNRDTDKIRALMAERARVAAQ
jgi:hypothetical protein